MTVPAVCLTGSPLQEIPHHGSFEQTFGNGHHHPDGNYCGIIRCIDGHPDGFNGWAKTARPPLSRASIDFCLQSFSFLGKENEIGLEASATKAGHIKRVLLYSLSGFP